LHVVVDDLWKNAGGLYNFGTRREWTADYLNDFVIKRARERIYDWLAHSLDLNGGETHVGMFDLETCRRAMTALDRVTYPDIREWARKREADRLVSFIESAIAPVADAAGKIVGVTGPRIPDAEGGFVRDTAEAWLRAAKPLGLILKLDSDFDVGFAEAASDLAIPYSVVLNPLQRARSDPRRIEAALVAANEIHVVQDELNPDSWICVRREILLRIDGLAVLPTKAPDALTRRACEAGKILFDIRRDLIADGYWNAAATELSGA
jgi:hypothetical protein